MKCYRLNYLFSAEETFRQLKQWAVLLCYRSDRVAPEDDGGDDSMPLQLKQVCSCCLVDGVFVLCYQISSVGSDMLFRFDNYQIMWSHLWWVSSRYLPNPVTVSIFFSDPPLMSNFVCPPVGSQLSTWCICSLCSLDSVASKYIW